MSEDVNSSQKRPRLGFSVRGPRDFWGGLVLILVAILALWAARDLPGQRGFAFGPGTAPRLFAGILAVLGAGVALVGLFVDGPRIERYKVRGPVLVIIAILLFAALIRPFGLVVSTFLAFIVSVSGSHEIRWVEAIIAAAAMTVGCILLFVYLLNLPFQLWPQPNAPVLLLHQFQDLIQGFIALFQKAPPRP
jgi:putative tricarboxylic transport membrane protein